MQIPPELEGVLVSTPDTLHGAARYKDTRVFAKSLSDYIMSGESLEVFVDHFPDVTREQSEALLKWEDARQSHEFGYELTA